MSRTRLAAAAGVAALTLGATAAVADDPTATQEVTITVTAAPRTLTTSGGAVVLTVVENTTGVDTEGVSTLAYANPTGNDSAKITVARTGGADLGDLELEVAATGNDNDSDGVAGSTSYTGEATASADLITSIDAGSTVNNNQITFTLTGDSAEAGTINTNVTFTITDNGV
jgi:hypothetical protein